MKLWIKAYKNEKLILNVLKTDNQPLTEDGLDTLLRETCDKHDLPMPIITETNIKNLIAFNHTKFKQCDFLEKIHFDYMEISRYK
jgi:hypothetical protein